jgi:hypothetical protein
VKATVVAGLDVLLRRCLKFGPWFPSLDHAAVAHAAKPLPLRWTTIVADEVGSQASVAPAVLGLFLAGTL